MERPLTDTFNLLLMNVRIGIVSSNDYKKDVKEKRLQQDKDRKRCLYCSALLLPYILHV